MFSATNNISAGALHTVNNGTQIERSSNEGSIYRDLEKNTSIVRISFENTGKSWSSASVRNKDVDECSEIELDIPNSLLNEIEVKGNGRT